MEKNKSERRTTYGLGLGEAIRRGVKARKGDRLSVLYDALVVLCAFLFSRCHAILGAYPLAISFVAALPSGVWLALLGAAVGSLSLGGIGIINAVIAVLVVLLRIIISGGDRRGERALFSEPLVLRVAASTIGAFVGAIYEVLLSGLEVASVLYGCASVLLTALFTLLMSGIFYTGITLSDIITSKSDVLSRGAGKWDARALVFQGSALVYLLLISYSLKGYELFGISSGYVFSSIATLLAARRFGAIRAMAVGFVSSLALSGVYSVAFALMGAAAGILFELGTVYALLAGGAALSAWSAYAGGALGFLTTFPEYILSAVLSMPLLKRLTPSLSAEGEEVEPTRAAEDMVNALALSYKGCVASDEALSASLSTCAKALRKVGVGEGHLTLGEYRDTVITTEAGFCPMCPSYAICVAETPAPCVEFADAVATKLYKRERLFPNDPATVPRYCHAAEELFSAIMRAAAERERERERAGRIASVAQEYELLSRVITEMHQKESRERAQNTAMTERLSELVLHSGLASPAVRVLGDERLHIIVAGGDGDGSIVTSPELHKEIEERCGIRLGEREYYRRGGIALLECSAAEKFSTEFFAVGKGKTGESASGDAVTSITDGGGHFLALISDGMGSGEEAHDASQLASELLLELLRAGVRRQTALHVVNHLIKSRAVECSATVDLFDFDLVTGEAVFYKCGAAPSYVKRGGSIFRISSETAPIGIAGAIDAERIRVEVMEGDLVIMLSDGISGGIEEGAWLLELLARQTHLGVREYAESILREAERRAPLADDVTVAVTRIVAASPR